MLKIPPNPWEGQPLYTDSVEPVNQLMVRPSNKPMKGGFRGGNLDTQIDEINILWKNGNYYLSMGETAGALVAFSNYAVYAHVLIDFIRSETGTAAAEGAAPKVAPKPTPKPIAGAEGVGELEKALNQTMQVALGYVETLQAKLSAITRGEEKGKEVEDAELCIQQTQDIIVQFKGKDCLTFNDIVGLAKEKNTIRDSFVRPIIYKRLYGKLAKGLLLYGPPGTGKTLLAKASATQLQLENQGVRLVFLAPTGASLKGKYVGETEKNIMRAFRCASVIAENAESKCEGGSKQYFAVLFIDEFDSIAGDRSTDTTGLVANSVNTLLQVIDGVISFPNVVLIAATNYPWNLDAAILRRFDQQLLLDYPSFEMIRDIALGEIRKHYFQPYWKDLEKKEKKIFTKKDPCEFECGKVGGETVLDENRQPFADFVYDFKAKNIDFQTLCDQLYSEKYSNSDVAKVVQLAIRQASSKSLKYPYVPGSFYTTNKMVDDENFDHRYMSVFSRPLNNQKFETLSESLMNIDMEQYGNIYLDETAYDKNGFLKAIIYKDEIYYNTKLILDLPSEFYLNDIEITDYFLTRNTVQRLKKRNGKDEEVTMIFSKDMKVTNAGPTDSLNFVNICHILQQYVDDPTNVLSETREVDISAEIAKSAALRKRSRFGKFRLFDIIPEKKVTAPESIDYVDKDGNRIYFEKQVGDLSCGRRAMNNALQGTYFLKDTGVNGNPKDIAALDKPPTPKPVPGSSSAGSASGNPYGLKQLMRVMNQVFKSQGLEGILELNWNDNENYLYYFINLAMEVAGWGLERMIFTHSASKADYDAFVNGLDNRYLETHKIIMGSLGTSSGHYYTFLQVKSTGGDYIYYHLDSMNDGPGNAMDLAGLKAKIGDLSKTGLKGIFSYKKKDVRTPLPEKIIGILKGEHTLERESQIIDKLTQLNKKIDGFTGKPVEERENLKKILSAIRVDFALSTDRYVNFLTYLNTLTNFDDLFTSDNSEMVARVLNKYESLGSGFMVGGARNSIDNLFTAYRQNQKVDKGDDITFTGKNVIFAKNSMITKDNIDDFNKYFKNYTKLNDLSYMEGANEDERKRKFKTINTILNNKVFALLKMDEVPYTMFFIVAKFILYAMRKMFLAYINNKEKEASREIQTFLLDLDDMGIFLGETFPYLKRGMVKKTINKAVAFYEEMELRDLLGKRKTVEKEGRTVTEPKSFEEFETYKGAPFETIETTLASNPAWAVDERYNTLLKDYFAALYNFQKEYAEWVYDTKPNKDPFDETKFTPVKTRFDDLENLLQGTPQTPKTTMEKAQKVVTALPSVLYDAFARARGYKLLKSAGGSRKYTRNSKNKTFKGGRGRPTAPDKSTGEKIKSAFFTEENKWKYGLLSLKGTQPLLELDDYIEKLKNYVKVNDIKLKEERKNRLLEYLFTDESKEPVESIETIAQNVVQKYEVRRYNSQFYFVSKFHTNAYQWRPTYYMDSRFVQDLFQKNTKVDFGKLQGDKSSLFKFLMTRTVALGFLSFGDKATKQIPNYNLIKWYDFKQGKVNELLTKYLGKLLSLFALQKAFDEISFFRETPEEAGGEGAGGEEAAPSASPSATPSPAAPSATPSPSATPAPNATEYEQAVRGLLGNDTNLTDSGSELPSASPLPEVSPAPSALPEVSTAPSASPDASALPSPSASPDASATPSPGPSPSGEPSPVGIDLRSATPEITPHRGKIAAALELATTVGIYPARESIVTLVNRFLGILKNKRDFFKGLGKYALERAVIVALYKFVVRPLREIWSGFDFVSLSLLASRNISAAGFNYYLTTQDKNYSALHASLLMTFEGKSEVYCDFSDETNLMDNLGEKLQEIFKNGTKNKLRESQAAFSDPDTSILFKGVTGLYEGLKWINSELCIYLYPALFNIAVPYNEYFVEYTGKGEGTFFTSKRINVEETLTNSIRTLKTLETKSKSKTGEDSSVNKAQSKVVKDLERLLKAKQYEFGTTKARYSAGATNYYPNLLEKQKEVFKTPKINKINQVIEDYVNLLLQEEKEIDEVKGKASDIKKVEDKYKSRVQKLLNDNDEFLFDLLVYRDLLQVPYSLGPPSVSAKVKELVQKKVQKLLNEPNTKLVSSAKTKREAYEAASAAAASAAAAAASAAAATSADIPGLQQAAAAADTEVGRQISPALRALLEELMDADTDFKTKQKTVAEKVKEKEVAEESAKAVESANEEGVRALGDEARRKREEATALTAEATAAAAAAAAPDASAEAKTTATTTAAAAEKATKEADAAERKHENARLALDAKQKRALATRQREEANAVVQRRADAAAPTAEELEAERAALAAATTAEAEAAAAEALAPATIATKAAAEAIAAENAAVEAEKVLLRKYLIYLKATKPESKVNAVITKARDDLNRITQLGELYLNYVIDMVDEIYKQTKRDTFINANYLLVNTDKLEAAATIEPDDLVNLNLPLSCLTEAMALFPSNYDKKIHDDLIAYNQNKNKFMEAYRARQKNK